jgi:hypothetical protein
VRLSGASPFPGPCGALALAQRGAEVEPSIAVDPRSPRRIVAAWMQDDGRSNLVMTSRDGGRTWTRVFVPGLTDCTGGTVAGAADPWLSFAPAGKLLLGSGIANLPHLPGPTFGPQPMQVVSRSGDGGLSWSLPATMQFAPGVYSDKSAATADPLRRGVGRAARAGGEHRLGGVAAGEVGHHRVAQAPVADAGEGPVEEGSVANADVGPPIDIDAAGIGDARAGAKREHGEGRRGREDGGAAPAALRSAPRARASGRGAGTETGLCGHG